jgi:YihY family inner membrane protein
VFKRLLDRIDQYQQAHGWAAFPYAVIRKFGDDQAGNLAALIAYFGFFSLFPLLLVFVTVLGFVLHGNEHLQHQILNSALAQFPIIGDQLKNNVGSLKGNGFGLIIGLVGALYGGLGVAKAGQNAMNEVWDVPMTDRPTFVSATLRSLAILIVGTVFIIATFGLTAIGSRPTSLGGAQRVLALGAAALLNMLLFLVLFRLMTVAAVRWRDVLPGAVFAGVGWLLLQTLGSLYINHQLKGASQVYGLFAVVIGLLSWIYLSSQMVLLAAEVNVVRTKHLWPRSVTTSTITEADIRTNEDQIEKVDRLSLEDEPDRRPVSP